MWRELENRRHGNQTNTLHARAPCSSCDIAACMNRSSSEAIRHYVLMEFTRCYESSENDLQNQFFEQVPAADEAQLPLEHIHNVGQSLPALASELLQAQHSQHEEVSQREDTIRILQAELKKDKEHLSSIEREICATAKGICLTRDVVAQTSLECDDLEKETVSIISETQELKSKLKRVREGLQEERKFQQRYRDKIANHVARMVEVDQASPVQQELERLRRQIAELKEKRSVLMEGDGLRVLSGEKQRELQEKAAETEATRFVLEQENEVMAKKVRLQGSHMQQLRREEEMAKKRHQAQLTRLHRQLQEAQARRRGWGEEAERLRTTAAQLRQKIQE